MTINWQPIETAPKCGRRILLKYAKNFPVVFGHWNEDKYSYKPKAYFSNDRERLYGVRETRANQPIAWSDDANESLL